MLILDKLTCSFGSFDTNFNLEICKTGIVALLEEVAQVNRHF